MIKGAVFVPEICFLDKAVVRQDHNPRETVRQTMHVFLHQCPEFDASGLGQSSPVSWPLACLLFTATYPAESIFHTDRKGRASQARSRAET